MKSKKIVLLLITMVLSFPTMAQSYNWNVTSNGITRDGVSFYMAGQSWAKQTAITYNLGTSCESDVKAKLSELSAIGVNTLRVYGSPDDSDFAGTSNFANLIKWIEEWNDVNPDGGDPNKAMYYMVQINPEDNLSVITDDLPANTSASFNRAIHDTSHPGSVASLVQTIDTITGGSDYLLGYQIYHELNGSTKYIDWYNVVGASGIESFMNAVADAIHNTYAPGKLVTHTGDAKQPTTDIYEQIENLDGTNGNVLENFDIIGFNLYISTKEMLNEGTYYDRIPQRRGFSVNSGRGWYIGETGASSDVAASTGIPAVNYTQSQGLANLQIMWQKSEALGNMIGFVLFTVQDNDLGAVVSDNIKQRGYFDHYGDKKFLYYAYPDVINEISTNDRYHYTDDHAIGISIDDNSTNYTITFDLENKTSSNKEFFWSIYGDDGSTSQRFKNLVEESYQTLSAGQSLTITKTVSKPTSNDLFAVELTVIDDLTPSNSYSYGRDHILSDAIGTVAGLNLNLSNLPDYGTASLPSQWSTQDVGAVGATGSVSYSNGTFSIEGSGSDIWNSADEFRYVYQEVSGDVTITARVASIENTNIWAKAGVMVRENLAAGSKHAMSVITPSRGTSFQRRTSTNGSSFHTTNSSISAPYWVRIERSGNIFSSYYSSNGTSWTSNGSVTISMNSNVYVGLVTTSHNDGTLCSSSIDNVTVTATSGSEVTLTINPSDDAYVRGGANANTNYGSASDLVIKQGSNSSFFRKSYVKFDLSGESLSSVTNAVVRLYANSVTSYTVTAYEATDSWNENSITWNNAPSEGSVVDAISVTSNGQYYEWDVTSYLQNEISSDGIVTLVFYDASASNQQIIFNSKEASSNIPELVVTGTSSSAKSSINTKKEIETDANISLRYSSNDNSIHIKNISDDYTEFMLFDITGRKIKQGNLIKPFIDMRDVNSKSILIIKLIGNNKKMITKKILLAK